MSSLITVFVNLKARQKVTFTLFCFTKAGDYYYYCKCNENLPNIKNSIIKTLLIGE